MLVGDKDDNATYTLTGDNSAFAGILEIAEGGTGSIVTLTDGKALGGEGTNLVLGGRSLVFDGGATNTAIKVASIGVKGTNLVGGSELNDANKAITITAVGRITGNGILANAAGDGETGFAHSLTGDLSGFEGTIVAGMATEGIETSISTWTLTHTGTESNVINAKLAGLGTVTDHGRRSHHPGRQHRRRHTGQRAFAGQ